MGVFQVIIGLLFIFIIPGYLISWLFLKKLDFFSRFGVSVGLSICINVLISLVLGFLGIFTSFFIYFLLSLIVLVLLIILRKNIVIYLKEDLYQLKDKKNLLIFVLLIMLLIFNFILIYRVHSSYTGLIQDPHNLTSQYYEVKNFRYDFPIHGDEWTHLAKAVYFIENKKIGFVNPYFEKYPPHYNYEIGFDAFISEFFLLTNLDPILSFKYLAAIFIIVNSLLLFVFARRFTNNNIGLLTILFFGSLKSNVNILGNWFFVPLTMSLFFMFLSFYLLADYLEKNNKPELFVLIFVYILSILVYPLISIFIAIIISIILIIKFYNKRITWYILLVLLIVCLIFILFFSLEKLSNLKFSNWTITSVGYIKFNIFRLYGYIFSFLAIIGLVLFFVKKYSPLLLVGLITPLFFIIVDGIFNQTYFIPYTRAVYYSLLFLILFSAIGLNHIFEFFGHTLDKKVLSGVIIIVILVILSYGLQNYQDINKQKNIANVESKNLVLIYFLENKDYEALKYFKSNYGTNKNILADPLVSLGVYPLSQNHIITMIESNLGNWRYDGSDGYWVPVPMLYFQFLESNCLKREKIIRDNDIDFVLSRYNVSCPKFVEIYNKGNYIYDVRSLNE